MWSMTSPGALRLLRRFILAGGLVAAGLDSTPATESPGGRVFQGACYCRAAGALQCIGNLSEAECRKRCTEALCDEWFWLERLPCWNWGYGG